MARPTLACLLLALACAGMTDERPVAPTEAGAVRGVRDEGALVFHSVPYAAPPVGELRFRPPEAPRRWSGVRDAREFRAVCPQPTFGMTDFLEAMVARIGISWWKRAVFAVTGGLLALPEGDEDCLTLTVWTPALEGSRPVMVWIHGGGHAAGSGSQLPTLGLTYARRDAVVVSINYRLGIFGYLAHSALAAESEHGSAGNYGTLDQIAALRWVRDNIAGFGGDPGRVTIFGESAGAMSVAQLMASPLARGLFHGAISQSGTAAHQFLHLDEPRHNLSAATYSGDLLLAALGREDAEEAAAALREASTEKIQAAFEMLGSRLMLLTHPNVDGWLLEESVARTFRDGRQAPVPWLVGFLADEGSLLYAFDEAPIPGGPAITSVDEWHAFVAEQFADDAPAVAALYPVEGEADLERAGEIMLGDSLFGAPTWFSARAHAAAGHPVYLYFMTREPASPTQTTGAYHGSDLQYVFDSPLPLFPWDEVDEALARTMVDYWHAFAVHGAPRADGQPEWPAFDPSEPRWMEFGDRTGLAPVTRLERFELMERHLIAPFLEPSAR
jgi:para-nitrobenzyl esterase